MTWNTRQTGYLHVKSFENYTPSLQAATPGMMEEGCCALMGGGTARRGFLGHRDFDPVLENAVDTFLLDYVSIPLRGWRQLRRQD